MIGSKLSLGPVQPAMNSFLPRRLPELSMKTRSSSTIFPIAAPSLVSCAWSKASAAAMIEATAEEQTARCGEHQGGEKHQSTFVKSEIQLVSQLFPPSAEKACSMRKVRVPGEMPEKMKRTRIARLPSISWL